MSDNSPDLPTGPDGASGISPAMVSVIVLNWNGWTDTVRCVRSLQAQTCTAWAAVIVDNGSSDNSVPELRRALADATLIANAHNLGFARGCNVGIERALDGGAEYIWLLNNDTIPEPEALAKMLLAAESDPRVGAVGAVLCDMDNPQHIQEWGGGWCDLRTGISGVCSAPPRRPLDYICGGCLLLRRPALLEVGLLDPGYFMYGEDTELSIRLRRAGWRLAVAADVRIRHRRGPSLPVLGRVFYSSAATSRTLRKYARFPLLATLTGLAYRVARNLAAGRWRRVIANITGAAEGWRAFARGAPYHLPARYAPQRIRRRQ